MIDSNAWHAPNFVSDAERGFVSRLQVAAGGIVENSKRFVMLAGPSCSGKTTAARLIKQTLALSGRTLLCLSIDDFYKGKSNTNTASVDFESVEALDYSYLQTCIKLLLQGKDIEAPIFDFSKRQRVGYRTCRVYENTVVLFEGIQAFYPEITELFPAAQIYRIFICPREKISFRNVVISARQLRLARRLVRDFRERDSDASRTFSIWASVVQNEEKRIFPAAHFADVRVDSTLAYEPFIIRTPLLHMLANGCDPAHAEQSETLKQLYEVFPALPSRLVPSDSVFREFIGGENND